MKRNNIYFDKLKYISNRGRVSYASACVVNALKFFNISNNLIGQEIVAVLNQFTDSPNLAEWDLKISDYDPEYYEDNFDITQDSLEFLTIEQGMDLKIFYDEAPQALIDIISTAIDIGRIEICTKLNPYGQKSLDRTIKILNLLEEEGILLPDVEHYTQHSFIINNGWGERF